MNNIYFFIIGFLFLSCNKKEGEKAVIIKKNEIEILKKSFSKIPQIKKQLNEKDTVNIPIGKINGYELVYDTFGEKWNLNLAIKIYYKKNNLKKLLLKPHFFYGDYTVGDVSIFKNKGDNFIYIGTSHTYGHYQGYLYYLNTQEMKTYEVKIKYKINREIEKIKDTLRVHKYIELTKDDKNNLGGGQTYFGKYTSYYCTCEYIIKKIGKNKYVLINKNDKCEEEG